MGYTTEFSGRFEIDRPVDEETSKLINGLNETRRMARDVDDKYGIEGEFYIEGKGYMGQDRDDTIIDYNRHPRTQPSLWCRWELSEDRKYIQWDGGEKFYEYVDWLKYLIKKILAPREYILNGEVEWFGEDYNDRGLIIVKNNVVEIKYGRVIYE